MTDYDVIIAGYGPTGLAAANLLGSEGLRILVLEPNKEIVDFPRAVHFDGEISRFFHSLGLGKEIEASCQSPLYLNFINGKGRNLFYQDVSSIDRYHGHHSMHFFGQPEIEKQLRDGASKFPNVEVKLGWALSNLDDSGEAVQVTGEERTNGQQQIFSCQYLLGADGASSPTRKLLGINMEDLECDEPWLVVDLYLDTTLDFKRSVYQVCDPQRPTTIVPCEPGHIRWEFMINADDDTVAIEHEGNVRALMAPHLHRLADGINPQDGELVRSKVYTFHGLIADSFQQGRVFILGDAAHQTPPFLGQGMCTGIRDAINISWKLAGVFKHGYDTKILDSYSSERRPQSLKVIKTAIQHGEVIQTRNPLKAFLRDSFLRAGKLFPPLISFLEFGTPWQIGAGLLEKDGQPAEQDVLGYPARQPLMTSNGDQRYMDETLGPGFALIGFDINPTEILERAALPPHCPELNTLKLTLENTLDQGKTIEWAAKHNMAIALLRPDRIIYGVCRTDTSDTLDEQLSCLLSGLAGQLH